MHAAPPQVPPPAPLDGVEFDRLTVLEAQRQHERLVQLEKRLRRQLAAVKQEQDTAGALAQRIASPWQLAQIVADECAANERRSLADALRAAQGLQERLSEIEVRLGKVRELAARLGLGDALIPDASESTDLATIAAEIDQRGDQMAKQLRSIERAEQRAAQVFEHVCAADHPLRHLPAPKDLARALRLVLTQAPRTRHGESWAVLCEDLELASWLVRAMLDAGDEAGVKAELDRKADALNLPQWLRLLSALELDHIQLLAAMGGRASAWIAFIGIVAGCILSDDLVRTFAETLCVTTNMTEACRKLVRELLHRRAAGETLSALKQLAAMAGAPAGQAETLRRELLKRIDQPIGMEGLYRIMRHRAHDRYVAPLRPLVERDDPAAARRLWDAAGDLKKCTREVAREFLEAGSSHEQQTERFLDRFDQDLRAWHDEATHGRVHDVDELRALESAVASEAASEPTAALLQQILAAAADCTFPDSFGQEPIARLAVDPTWTTCWLATVDRRAPTNTDVLVDLIRRRSGRGPGSLAEAVRYFLGCREYAAAETAAADDPGLRSLVHDELQRRQDALRHEFAEALAAAAKLRDDEMIAFFVEEIEQDLQKYAFEAARKSLIELEEQIRRARVRRDPRYIAARNFLGELGELVPQDIGLDRLLERVELARQAHEPRRRHLTALVDGVSTQSLPQRALEALQAVAQSLDRPRIWLDEPQAQVAAVAIRSILRYVQMHYTKYRSYHPEEIDQLCELLPGWFDHHLQVMVGSSDRLTYAATHFEQLTNEISDGCPVGRVLQVVKRTELVERVRNDLSSRRARDAYRPVGFGADEILGELDRRIGERMRAEDVTGVEVDARSLRNLVLVEDWRGLRRQAAVNLQAQANNGHSGLTLNAAAYAMAVVFEVLPADPDERADLLRTACLATILVDRAQLKSSFPDRYIDELFARSLTALNKPGVTTLFEPRDLDDLQVSLEGILKTLGAQGLGEGGAVRTWLADLLASASRFELGGMPGSALLALKLWELFAKQTGNYQPRADLLYLLFRLHHADTLRALARHHSLLVEVLVPALEAFERGEVDDEMHRHALQLSEAFRQQTAGERYSKPWAMLLMRLAAPVGAIGEALRCQPEGEVAEESAPGRFILQFRIEPQHQDPPAQLIMEIQGQRVDLVARDEVLWRAKVEAIELPFVHEVQDGDIIEVPYKITGATIRGEPIDLRGAFTLAVSRGAHHPLTSEEILRTWPGSTGEPVSIDRGFVGRQRELKQVEQLLRSDDRQRSVMLIGQRRIGKTSLLLELVRSYPPQQGKIAGVFVDVSGLDLPPGASMQMLLYRHLIESLLSHKANEPVRAVISAVDPIRKHWRLAPTDQAERSLSLALEQLVERLKMLTDGRIGRIAFFIDEFDRFVEPWLSGRREEADRLMWNIRQIVQQSETVSLVLAGSGLQQLFTRHYADALYGSIPQVRIEPFSYAEDRAAVLDTFLPSHVRQHLSPPRDQEELVRYAHDLCGGHPYYLALLGFSATVMSKGRRLSQPRLHLAIDAMIRGDVRGSSRRVDAEIFFSHFFETWTRLPQRARAIARCLLAHLAQKTTLEYPWLSVSRVLDVLDLRRRTDPIEREEALQVLVEDGAVKQEGGFGEGRVRVRVPITQMALQLAAVKIYQEAVRDLPIRE